MPKRVPPVPWKVGWRTVAAAGGSGPGDVLAYEKIGEGGKHYIVTPMGAAFELDEAELKRRVPSAK